MTDKSRGLRKHDIRPLTLYDVADILQGAGKIQTRWMTEPMIVIPERIVPSMVRRLVGPLAFQGQKLARSGNPRERQDGK